MIALHHRIRSEQVAHPTRRAFTLVELLITIAIIGLMAGMALAVTFTALEAGKAAKTKALVAKLDSIIRAKYEAYRTRRVPINTTLSNPQTPVSPMQIAAWRLFALHDVMRMELPDRWTDVTSGPVTPPGSLTTNMANAAAVARPSVSQSYLRRYNAIMNGSNPPTLATAQKYQGAECLYMIVMAAVAEDADGRDVFRPADVGDVDGDGFPEFIDGWGMPIRFLRWAPGFQLSELQVAAKSGNATVSGSGGSITVTAASGSTLPMNTAPQAYDGYTMIGTNGNSFDTSSVARVTSSTASGNVETINYSSSGSPTFSNGVWLLPPDPFDVTGAYPSFFGGASDAIPFSFALYPLIYSAGPNKVYGITADVTMAVDYTSHNLNPFFVASTTPASMIGNAIDSNPPEDNFVPNGWLDNIHNHLQGLR